ncbi:MAG: hypothetical protein LBE12_08965 [Planctomycetaceae bacterium]|nr:hypothetical protein [Planctomycetaceae bacterium]
MSDADYYQNAKTPHATLSTIHSQLSTLNYLLSTIYVGHCSTLLPITCIVLKNFL